MTETLRTMPEHGVVALGRNTWRRVDRVTAPRETALIAQLARYHRRGTPSLDDLEPLARKGDEDLLRRGAALLRLSEQLERARDQAVTGALLTVADGHADLRLAADEDVTLARWMAERETELFERAFGVGLRLVQP